MLNAKGVLLSQTRKPYLDSVKVQCFRHCLNKTSTLEYYQLMPKQVIILDRLLKQFFSFKRICCYLKIKQMYLINQHHILRNSQLFHESRFTKRKLFQLSTAEFQLQNSGIIEENQYLLIFSDITGFLKNNFNHSISMNCFQVTVSKEHNLRLIHKIALGNYCKMLHANTAQHPSQSLSFAFAKHTHDAHTTSWKLRQMIVSVHPLMQTGRR